MIVSIWLCFLRSNLNFLPYLELCRVITFHQLDMLKDEWRGEEGTESSELYLGSRGTVHGVSLPDCEFQLDNSVTLWIWQWNILRKSFYLQRYKIFFWACRCLFKISQEFSLRLFLFFIPEVSHYFQHLSTILKQEIHLLIVTVDKL